MKGFGSLTRAAFKTGPNGERLFVPGGPLSRPYVIPDEATEERLVARQRLVYGILFGFIVLGQPLLFSFFPNITRQPAWFLAYLVGLTTAFCLIGWIVLRRELRGLERLPTRMPVGRFFADMSFLSTGALALGFVGCLLFVACGVWMAQSERDAFMGWLCVGIFSLFALAWGYALLNRLAARGTEATNQDVPA